MSKLEYEERIHSEQGNYIVASSEEFENILKKESLIFDTTTIHPGEMTDLFGWFYRPGRYIGILQRPDKFKAAIFYLGQGKPDLFQNGGVYYDLTYIITSDRIGKSYRPGTFRDCYLRKKNNKYYWK